MYREQSEKKKVQQRIILSRKEVFVIVARHLVEKGKLPESFGAADVNGDMGGAGTALMSLPAANAPQAPSGSKWGDDPAMTFSWTEEVPG